MKRKIYDCFLFANELELLELRMQILNPYVDYFLLLESPYSFPGEEKEMIFEKNKHKFDTSKIIHVICDTLPYIGNVNGKLRKGKRNEWFSRDFMLNGLKDADPEDIIILSDIDEIPNPKTLMSNLHLLDDERISKSDQPHFGLKMHFFYYYMNYLVRGTKRKWAGSVVCKCKDFFKHRPSHLRKVRGANAVKRGGWHYSYLGGVDKIQQKLAKLGSVQFNQKRFTNSEHLERCLRKGRDLFGRRQYKFKSVDPEEYGPKEIGNFIKKYPQYIRNQK